MEGSPSGDEPKSFRSASLKRMQRAVNEIVPADTPETPRGPSQMIRMMQSLSDTFIFSQCDASFKDTVLSTMSPQRFPMGTKVVSQGEFSDKLFIIDQGKLNVFITTTEGDKEITNVSAKSAGDSFGEMSLVTGGPVVGTVRCVTDAIVWVLSRSTLGECMHKLASSDPSAFERLRATMQFARLRPLLFQQHESFTQASYSEGDVVAAAGAPVPHLSIVKEGLVRAEASGAEMGPYTLFGEGAALPGSVYPTTYRAGADTTVLQLPAEQLEAPLQEHLARILDMQIVVSALRGLPPCKKLTEVQVGPIIDSFSLAEFSRGQAIVSQGEAGQNLFVVRTGEVSLGRAPPGGGPVQLLTRLGSRAAIGGRALLTGEPQSATAVVASDAASTIVIPAASFHQIIKAVDVDARVRQLLHVHALSGIRRVDLKALAAGLQIERFESGQLIVTAHGEAKFGIVRRGAVLLRGPSHELRINTGEFFGENVLFSNEVSEVSVVAEGETSVFAITHAQLLADLPAVHAVLASHRRAHLAKGAKGSDSAGGSPFSPPGGGSPQSDGKSPHSARMKSRLSKASGAGQASDYETQTSSPASAKEEVPVFYTPEKSAPEIDGVPMTSDGPHIGWAPEVGSGSPPPPGESSESDCELTMAAAATAAAAAAGEEPEEADRYARVSSDSITNVQRSLKRLSGTFSSPPKSQGAGVPSPRAALAASSAAAAAAARSLPSHLAPEAPATAGPTSSPRALPASVRSSAAGEKAPGSAEFQGFSPSASSQKSDGFANVNASIALARLVSGSETPNEPEVPEAAPTSPSGAGTPRGGEKRSMPLELEPAADASATSATDHLGSAVDLPQAPPTPSTPAEAAAAVVAVDRDNGLDSTSASLDTMDVPRDGRISVSEPDEGRVDTTAPTANKSLSLAGDQAYLAEEVKEWKTALEEHLAAQKAALTALELALDEERAMRTAASALVAAAKGARTASPGLRPPREEMAPPLTAPPAGEGAVSGGLRELLIVQQALEARMEGVADSPHGKLGSAISVASSSPQSTPASTSPQPTTEWLAASPREAARAAALSRHGTPAGTPRSSVPPTPVAQEVEALVEELEEAALVPTLPPTPAAPGSVPPTPVTHEVNALVDELEEAALVPTQPPTPAAPGSAPASPHSQPAAPAAKASQPPTPAASAPAPQAAMPADMLAMVALLRRIQDEVVQGMACLLGGGELEAPPAAEVPAQPEPVMAALSEILSARASLCGEEPPTPQAVEALVNTMQSHVAASTGGSQGPSQAEVGVALINELSRNATPADTPRASQPPTPAAPPSVPETPVGAEVDALVDALAEGVLEPSQPPTPAAPPLDPAHPQLQGDAEPSQPPTPAPPAAQAGPSHETLAVALITALLKDDSIPDGDLAALESAVAAASERRASVDMGPEPVDVGALPAPSEAEATWVVGDEAFEESPNESGDVVADPPASNDNMGGGWVTTNSSTADFIALEAAAAAASTAASAANTPRAPTAAASAAASLAASAAASLAASEAAPRGSAGTTPRAAAVDEVLGALLFNLQEVGEVAAKLDAASESLEELAIEHEDLRQVRERLDMAQGLDRNITAPSSVAPSPPLSRGGSALGLSLLASQVADGMGVTGSESNARLAAEAEDLEVALAEERVGLARAYADLAISSREAAETSPGGDGAAGPEQLARAAMDWRREASAGVVLAKESAGLAMARWRSAVVKIAAASAEGRTAVLREMEAERVAVLEHLSILDVEVQALQTTTAALSHVGEFSAALAMHEELAAGRASTGSGPSTQRSSAGGMPMKARASGASAPTPVAMAVQALVQSAVNTPASTPRGNGGDPTVSALMAEAAALYAGAGSVIGSRAAGDPRASNTGSVGSGAGVGVGGRGGESSLDIWRGGGQQVGMSRPLSSLSTPRTLSNLSMEQLDKAVAEAEADLASMSLPTGGEAAAGGVAAVAAAAAAGGGARVAGEGTPRSSLPHHPAALADPGAALGGGQLGVLPAWSPVKTIIKGGVMVAGVALSVAAAGEIKKAISPSPKRRAPVRRAPPPAYRAPAPAAPAPARAPAPAVAAPKPKLAVASTPPRVKWSAAGGGAPSRPPPASPKPAAAPAAKPPSPAPAKKRAVKIKWS